MISSYVCLISRQLLHEFRAMYIYITKLARYFILWNKTDERFQILTPYSFKKELSMHFLICIKFYY